MADLSDVENGLVQLISAVVYPNGVAQPSVLGTGVGVIIYPGWPNPQTLDADLAAVGNKAVNGRLHVSVYPRPEEHNTTRYMPDWQQLTAPANTITLAAAGQQITVGGALPVPFAAQNLAVFVNGLPYTYSVQAGDSPTSIAAALAALINATVSGTSSAGPVISLPANARIGALRVGGVGTSVKEVRRQERLFQITIWANSEANRTALARPIDAALAGAERFTLADQSSARLIYKSSPVLDTTQKANLYRRDLLYTVEYPTLLTEQDYQITVEQTNVAPAADGATRSDVTNTVYN